MTKSNAWRPTVMTKEVVCKLEEWFTMWFTDVEACLYADISKASLYEYCKLNPEFTDRKELLKEQPKMKAKANITKKIEEWDDYNSRWYLERKAKNEFSLKVETDNTNVNTEITTDSLSEEQKRLIAKRFG